MNRLLLFLLFGWQFCTAQGNIDSIFYHPIDQSLTFKVINNQIFQSKDNQTWKLIYTDVMSENPTDWNFVDGLMPEYHGCSRNLRDLIILPNFPDDIFFIASFESKREQFNNPASYSQMIHLNIKTKQTKVRTEFHSFALGYLKKDSLDAVQLLTCKGLDKLVYRLKFNGTYFYIPDRSYGITQRFGKLQDAINKFLSED